MSGMTDQDLHFIRACLNSNEQDSRVWAALDRVAARLRESQPKDGEGQAVAWMHDHPGRVDVIHADVKDLLVKAKSVAAEHYTIPLFRSGQSAARVDDEMVRRASKAFTAAGMRERALPSISNGWMREALEAALSTQPAPFQSRVAPWMQECFGAAIASDVRERGDRLLEEVLELLQSHGYDPSRVATLRDYVFGRPIGEPQQEVGGVMVTLAAYCLATGIDMHTAGDTELARISAPEVVERIRLKQASKRGLHTPLPVPPAAPSEQVAASVAVPEGWRLVPVEPTPEMQHVLLPCVMRQFQTRSLYASLLAAAPVAPVDAAIDTPK